MRIVVLGSGVVGVTAAWYLAEAGHDVVVVDRKEGPALETSFANAGEISPGYASPWAAPAIPWKAVRWLLMRHPPLIRSEEHTSELQSLMRISYAVFCLKKKKNLQTLHYAYHHTLIDIYCNHTTHLTITYI